MSDLFFLTELQEGTRQLASDVRLAHPFLLDPVEGVDAVMQSLRAGAAALGSEVEPCSWFRGDSAAAVAWQCGPAGREIQGVTLALINAQGEIGDLRIALRPVQFLDAWREQLRPWLASQPGAWELAPPSAGTAGTAELVHRRLPFPAADDAVFHGPVFVRPVRGASAVSHVIAHAGAAYGEYELGPALRNGTQFLRTFTTKALPLEVISIFRLDGNDRAAELTVFMQPWPSMMVFRDRLRALLGGYLDASFYD